MTAVSRRVRRALAVLAGIAAALLLLEGALRILDVAPPAVTKVLLLGPDPEKERWHCYPSNPGGAFQPLPDVSGGGFRAVKLLDPPVEVPLSDLERTPWCVEYRFGAEGLRGPAPSPVPMPGTLRIAGIGDSFAFGEGVAFEDTLFARLAAELGAGHEVLNLAQSGADLDLDVRTLAWGAAKWRCSRALLVVVPNDVGLTDALRTRENRIYDLINLREEHLAEERPWLLRASRTASVLLAGRERARIAAATLDGYRDAYDPAQNGANLRAMEELFRSVAELPGCRTAVVIHPLLVGLSDTYPLAAVHAEIAAMCERAGLPVLDLAPAFEGLDEAELHVHPADHHPNGRAHALAARAVAAWLRDEVPGFLRPR